LVNWDTPLTLEQGERMMAVLNAYRQEYFGPGRHRGRGARWATREDLIAAIENAIDTLRKHNKRVTQVAVARYLVAQGPRNMTERWHAGKGPADPGRQLRTWCDQFEVDIKAMISGL
jgi:hypothetical protein